MLLINSMQLFFIMFSERETHNSKYINYVPLYNYVNINHVFHVLFMRFMLFHMYCLWR